MAGRIDFTMGFNVQGAQRKLSPDSSYRIYILGHFSGRHDIAWPQRKIYKIDRDSFEQVFAQMAPEIDIDAGGTSLCFASLDDFHPDVWLHKVGIIAELLDLKRQLQNPNTAAQAASKIQAFLPAELASHPARPPQATPESQEEMLLRLLGKKSETPVTEKSSIDGWLKDLVAPHVTQAVGSQYQSLIQIIDATVTQFARTLLHSPAFQSREALWRATYALLTEEVAERHAFYLLDIAQEELAAALENGEAQGFTQKILQHSQSTDPEQAVLLLSDFNFSANQSDDALLAYCASLAAASAGRLFAAVDQTFIQRLTEAGVSHAAHAGLMLAYPRYLVRLPYGEKRDPIETFPFKESAGVPQAQELLWGNPAFLLARAILRLAADETSEEALFFGDIPLFSFEQDGESVLQPGVETVLTEAQANHVLAQGITPLLGYRQRKGVRLLGFAGLDENLLKY